MQLIDYSLSKYYIVAPCPSSRHSRLVFVDRSTELAKGQLESHASLVDPIPRLQNSVLTPGPGVFGSQTKLKVIE